MRNLFLVAGFAVLLSLSLTSCASEDPAEGVDIPELFATANVEGFVHLNVNQSGNEIIKYAPEGTLLSFTIAHSDFGIDGAEGNFVVTTQVGSDGKYSVELPAKNDGTAVTVRINGNPFVLEVENGFRTETQLFTVPQNSQSLIKGFSYHKDLTYSGEILTETENWVDGTINANFVYLNPTTENPANLSYIPSGTAVKVTVPKEQFVPQSENDYVEIVTIGNNGSFSFKMKAPTVQMKQSGLQIIVSSSVILSVSQGDNTNRYIFYLPGGEITTLYGDYTMNKGTIQFTRGTQL